MINSRPCLSGSQAHPVARLAPRVRLPVTVSARQEAACRSLSVESVEPGSARGTPSSDRVDMKPNGECRSVTDVENVFVIGIEVWKKHITIVVVEIRLCHFGSKSLNALIF